jgi:HMG (high mobility group) box
MPTSPTTPTAIDVRRPLTAWILYRSDVLARLPRLQGQNQSEVSKLIAKMWYEETQEVRDEYLRQARKKSEEHRKMYSYCVSRPMKEADKLHSEEKEPEGRITRSMVSRRGFQLANDYAGLPKRGQNSLSKKAPVPKVRRLEACSQISLKSI